jgi:hypothetical protein
MTGKFVLLVSIPFESIAPIDPMICLESPLPELALFKGAVHGRPMALDCNRRRMNGDSLPGSGDAIPEFASSLWIDP